MDPERKERLGRKWTCYSCEGRFYDLNKPEPICPRCSADQREAPDFEVATRKKTTRKKAATKKKAAKKKAAKLPKIAEEEEMSGDVPVEEIDPSDLGPDIASDAD